MKKLVIIGLILGAIGVGIAYKMYNKPKADLATEKADFIVNALDFFKEFSDNEDAASAKYNGKIIEVSGVLNKVNNMDSVIFLALEAGDPMNAISCKMSIEKDFIKTEIENKEGTEITVRGECSGINFDVELINCVLINK
jgi:hypothetical protein